MTENGDEYRDAWSRALEQIEELCSVAGGADGREAITRLSGCPANLNATLAAKCELASLPADEVRGALTRRRNSLRGAQ